MEPKKIALLVGAVVVALVTALLARQMFVSSAAPVASAAPQIFAAPKGPKVLVATRALPAGTILEDNSYKYQPWPKDLLQGAYYVQDEGKTDVVALRGSVVRNPIAAGQPITVGSVVQPGDRGFLAAALGPGMRAITVAVRTETSVAGFVFPGDRVDLMLTQTVAGGGEGGGPPLKTTETIMRNLRVLATDQRTSSEDEKGQKEVKQFQTVTLEVTPRIGEKIAVAQTIGTLSLSLRPLAESTAELERAIASGQVNVPKDGDVNAERTMALRIAAQPTDATPTFVTGADVSRFQRRSAPAMGPAAQRPVERIPAGGSTAAATGPMVHVARGNTVTDVPIGGK
ncbi:MAG: Flp pilus assembly protein CpaB [Sphingomonadales bacterium]